MTTKTAPTKVESPAATVNGNIDQELADGVMQALGNEYVFAKRVIESDD